MLGQVVLGKYKVYRLLDEGGMSKIYLARQANRDVVVKVLKPGPDARPRRAAAALPRRPRGDRRGPGRRGGATPASPAG